MQNASQLHIPYGFLILSAVINGCNGRTQSWKLVPVSGTITKAGQPLAGIQVVFLADVASGTKAPRASGVTDEVGRFHLGIDGGETGAFRGHYRVCLLEPEVNDEGTARTGRKAKRRMVSTSRPERDTLEKAKMSQVPSEFREFKKTPLRAEVENASQNFDFNLP